MEEVEFAQYNLQECGHADCKVLLVVRLGVCVTLNLDYSFQDVGLSTWWYESYYMDINNCQSLSTQATLYIWQPLLWDWRVIKFTWEVLCGRSLVPHVNSPSGTIFLKKPQESSGSSLRYMTRSYQVEQTYSTIGIYHLNQGKYGGRYGSVDMS